MRAAVSGVSKYQSTGAGADESLGRRFRRNSLSRAAAADRDGIAQDEPLVFIPRQVPLTPATRGGFAVFMVFLVTFTIIVRMERNDDVFFFAEHARQLVGVDDFRRLGQDRHSYREYQQWFEYHFLDGMANASTRLDPGASVALVGPPRIRQIRYAANCTDSDGRSLVPDYVAGIVPSCQQEDAEDETPFGIDVPDGLHASDGRWNWVSADETRDGRHVGRLHYDYTGAGYLLDTLEWVEKESDVYDPGSEFYPFAHWKVNASGLWSRGWIDKYTKAIFHDFTLYSASQDLYANVRVTAEFESNAAIFHMMINLRVFWLDRGTLFMTVQYVFATFLAILILGELDELRHGLKGAEKVLVERVVELKYLLRLKELQFGAEHGVTELYKPRRVLRKLAFRLYQVDASCTHHITALNGIGKKIPPLDDHYEDALRMLHASGMEGSSKAFHPNPVVTENLAKAQARLLVLRDQDGGMWHKLHQAAIRLRCSVRYYYSTEWNSLDSFNYLLLTGSFCARLYSWSMMADMRTSIENLDRQNCVTATGPTPCRFLDENYINFYRVAFYFGISFFVNAFSAMLTWIKLFKFLNFFPEMSIFTKTLTSSAQHLSVFFLVVLIVITGSAQGFCLAFGTDVDGFRDPFISILSIALFTVGKFDYEELVWSQRWLGPLLFWVYIFLVFFVMMSVFIAILSEGYEAAKSVIPATASGNIWEAVQTVAVRNYREMKSDMGQSFRKVTGQNKAQDRWVKGINKARVGVQVAGALAAFQEAQKGAQGRHLGATEGESTRDRLMSNKEANIATDSDSDTEEGGGIGSDTVYRELAKVKAASVSSKTSEDDDASVESAASTQGSLPGQPADSEPIIPSRKRAQRVMTMQAMSPVDEDSDHGGSSGMVSAAVAERLEAMEERLEKLAGQTGEGKAQLDELQEQLETLSKESKDALAKILAQLQESGGGGGGGGGAQSAGRRHGARRSPPGEEQARAGSHGRSHGHHRGGGSASPSSHQHRSGSHHSGRAHAAGSVDRQRPSPGAVRATSPSPTSGSAAIRHIGPTSRSRSPPVGLGSGRAGSTGRAVPNMRQQLAALSGFKAAGAKANGSGNLSARKSVPSMRQQMAAAMANSGSNVSPPR